MKAFNLTVIGGSADGMLETSPGIFSGDFEEGTELEVAAHIPEGYRFIGWEDEGYSEPSKPIELPPHHLIGNPSALEVNISNRIQISSRADKDFVLVGYDGLSSAPSELAHLDHAILDGGIVTGGRAKSRPVTFEFVAKYISYPAISSMFPLGQMETIEVMRGSTTRIIEGYRSGPLEISAESALATPVVSVSFLCPRPYFRNDRVITTHFQRTEDGLTYPLTYPLRYGMIVDNRMISVENNGDYPTPFLLEVTAAVGGNLGININGEQKAVIDNVEQGQTVRFDTDSRMLWINNEKSFENLRGGFPTIPLGQSMVELTGLTGLAALRFSEIYEGV